MLETTNEIAAKAIKTYEIVSTKVPRILVKSDELSVQATVCTPSFSF